MIKVGNIVEFNDQADHLAAVWCRENGIKGKVLTEESGVLKLDVGLYYHVFARPTQLIFVAEQGQISKLSPEIEATAPIPDDVGN
jgi:hypothetical protein